MRLLRRDQHPDRPPAGLQQLAVTLRQVVLALVQHGQAHHVPGHRDRADLLHLEDPAGGDPGPRADRVEPEVDARRCLLCWLIEGSCAPSTAGKPAQIPQKGRSPGDIEPDPRRGGDALGAHHGLLLPGGPGPDRRRRHVRLGQRDQVRLRRAGVVHASRPDRARGPRDHPERRAGQPGRVRRRPDHADRAGRRQRAPGGGRLRLLAQRRGAAPVHRPRRRARLPVLGPGDLRRAPGLRLLRPAGHEGQLRARRHRPGGLAGRVEHGAGIEHPGRARRGGAPLAFPAHAGHADLHHRGRGRALPRGPRRARRHPARRVLPPVAGLLPRRRRDPGGDAAGL